MATIKKILAKTGNSFGDKKVLFIGADGRLYIASRAEGDHSELEVGKVAYDAVEAVPDKYGDVLFGNESYNVTLDLSIVTGKFSRNLWSYFIHETLRDQETTSAKIFKTILALEEIVHLNGGIPTYMGTSINPSSTEDRAIVRALYAIANGNIISSDGPDGHYVDSCRFLYEKYVSKLDNV